MVFGFVADSLTTTTSVLFPIFASYKAIRTSDPAQLTPWLMYWTTLSLFLAGESFAYPIVSWLPFYSWMRLGVHLYLVMPGQQGSVYLYQTYIHPYLEQHERSIDRFISDSHERAKRAGLQYLNEAIEYIKVNILKFPPRQPPPPPASNATYTQTLLSRFNMPAARAGLATAGTSDLFSLLGNAMQQATYPSSRSRDSQAEDLSASGSLIPPHMIGEERTKYISSQRDMLQTLLQAFDKEAHGEQSMTSSFDRQQGSPTHRGVEGSLRKNRSELEFEDLAYEDVPKAADRRPENSQRQASWSNWIWGNYGEKDSALVGKKEQ